MADTQERVLLDDFVETGELERLIDAAITEDLGATRLDITSRSLIRHNLRSRAAIVARQEGVLAGLAVVPEILNRIGCGLSLNEQIQDGAMLEPGTVIGHIEGPADDLLAAERTVLNFLTHLSGIATATSRLVRLVEHTQTRICDTRKTIPGLRSLAKYAAAIGGALSHRMGLYDAVLVKDNHLSCLPGDDQARSEALGKLIVRWREGEPIPDFIEVEVDTIDQLRCLLQLPQPSRPDMVLLDNMSPQMLAAGVALRDQLAPEVKLEASGRINEETAKAVAESGVDRISSGAITHSAPALDIGLDFEPLSD